MPDIPPDVVAQTMRFLEGFSPDDVLRNPTLAEAFTSWLAKCPPTTIQRFLPGSSCSGSPTASHTELHAELHADTAGTEQDCSGTERSTPEPEHFDTESEASDPVPEIPNPERRPAKKTRYSRQPRNVGENTRETTRHRSSRARQATVVTERSESDQPAPSTAVVPACLAPQERSGSSLSSRSPTPQPALLRTMTSTPLAQSEGSVMVETVPLKIQKCLENIDISHITVLRERYSDAYSLWFPGGRNVLMDGEASSNKLRMLWRSHETTSDQLDASAICLAFINLLFAGYQNYIIRTRGFQAETRGRGKTDITRALDTIAIHIWGGDYRAKRKALQGAINAGEKIRAIAKLLTIASIFLVGARLSILLTLDDDELQEFSRHVHSKYADFETHAGMLAELGRVVMKRGIQIYNLPLNVDDVLDPPEALTAPCSMVEGSSAPCLASSDLAAYPHTAQHHPTGTLQETDPLQSNILFMDDRTQYYMAEGRQMLLVGSNLPPANPYDSQPGQNPVLVMTRSQDGASVSWAQYNMVPERLD